MKDTRARCHICGAIENRLVTKEEWDNVKYDDDINTTSELVKCHSCGEFICEQDEGKCCVMLNEDIPYCRKCLDKMELFDCNKCKTEDCPFNREFECCYECPEYIDEIE